MQTIFVSIGSNIDAESNMLLVKEHLNLLFKVTYSGIYQTPAEGFTGGDFLNSVCKFKSDKQPDEIRRTLKSIEEKMGRTTSQKGMSNRVIDLDLILLNPQPPSHRHSLSWLIKRVVHYFIFQMTTQYEVFLMILGLGTQKKRRRVNQERVQGTYISIGLACVIVPSMPQAKLMIRL